MLWYFPHPAVCWDFLANFAKDEKYLCVRSGKAETTNTEQQKIFSWFQVYSQLSCSIAEMSQILRRCYAINWRRDEEQNSCKIFVWCQTPSDILGCCGLRKLWAKTRNYGHWQNSERIRDFFLTSVAIKTPQHDKVGLLKVSIQKEIKIWNIWNVLGPSSLPDTSTQSKPQINP